MWLFVYWFVGITENRAMVLHSILVDGFGSFTCYIPVLTPDVL